MVTAYGKIIKISIKIFCTFMLQALVTVVILFLLTLFGGNIETEPLTNGDVILQEFLGQIPGLGALFSSLFQWLSFTGVHTSQLQATLFTEIGFILLCNVCYDLYAWLAVFVSKLTEPNPKSISFVCVPSTVLCAAITALGIQQTLHPLLVNAGYMIWFIVLVLGYLVIVLWPLRKQYKLSITTAIGKSALALGLKCLSALLISLVIVCYACLTFHDQAAMEWTEYFCLVVTLVGAILGLTLTSSVLFARVFES